MPNFGEDQMYSRIKHEPHEWWEQEIKQVQKERDEARAEVERMKAEVKRIAADDERHFQEYLSACDEHRDACFSLVTVSEARDNFQYEAKYEKECKKKARKERDEALAEVERLRTALRQCVETIENTGWGWDGDCGSVDEINRIADAALEGEGDEHIEAIDVLREGAAACAAGPWQFVADGAKPLETRHYLCRVEQDGKCGRLNFRYNNVVLGVVHLTSGSVKWGIDPDERVTAFAEIRECKPPDHIPAAGKMIEDEAT